MLVGVAVIGRVSLPSAGGPALVPRLVAAGALLVVAALHAAVAPAVSVVLAAVVPAGLAGIETARRLRSASHA